MNGNNFQAMALGYQPDLIAAVGENGVEGYVRASELYDDGVSCPADAANARTNYYVSLYKEDGVTIIGRFFVGSDNSTYAISRVSDYAYGDWGQVNYSDYVGYTQNGIRAYATGVTGKTSAWSDTTLGVGWLGITVQIFSQSTGNMVASSGFAYNTTATTRFDREYSHFTLKTSEGYYCQGTVQFWDSVSDSYHTHGTFRTTIVQPG